ncbi:MAG: lipid-A-disaccharide synthase, partial [Xanthomonadales bacterium]|nr:lipid-A-disaccharide synthase [Xanthomonadales bacterium]
SLLAAPMLRAAALMAARRPGLRFVAALANETVADCFEQAMRSEGFANVTPVLERSREVMTAADVVLCASGTATLETMLINRPLVMAYRLARSTYLAAKHLRLIRRQRFALPNILAAEELVPELIQDEASAERLAAETERWLDDPAAVAALRARFGELHERLRCDAAGRAAEAVAGLLASKRS